MSTKCVWFKTKTKQNKTKQKVATFHCTLPCVFNTQAFQRLCSRVYGILHMVYGIYLLIISIVIHWNLTQSGSNQPSHVVLWITKKTAPYDGWNMPIRDCAISSGVARAFSGGRLAHPEGQNEEEISKVWGKIRKIDQSLRKKNEEVELLPTRNCEAGYGLAISVLCVSCRSYSCFKLKP